MLRFVRLLGITAAMAVVAVSAHAVSDPPPIVAGGPRSDSAPVHPPSSSANADVSRDCGFSVELRDARALWIYCDSSDAGVGTEPTWFINNSAAFAWPTSPRIMREPLNGRGEPYPFIVPNGYNPCGDDPHIIWPTSAVVVPDGAVDRVVVYYENVCQVGGNDIFGVESRSMGVAEYVYDPAADPLAQPIRATILDPNLWSSPSKYGHASVLRGGHLYVYQCEYTWGEPWGCRVGRVDATVPGQAQHYRFWTGSSWVTSRSEATFMAIPGTDTPGSAYQVTYVPEWGAYTMTYIAWPGIGATMKVRVARNPWGPWSDAVDITLPRCGAPDYCYAAALHTQLTKTREMGVGYYDPSVAFADRPTAGQVRAITQPVFPPFQEPWTFWDVPPEHPFFAEIEWVAAAGVAQGYADTWYHPTDLVSRQSMAAFLQRLVDGTIPPAGTPSFTDVPLTHQFSAEIEWVAATGIAEGFPDGTFRPTAGVGRQSMAAFLHRLAGSPTVSPVTGFADVPIDHPFATEIAWLVSTGITTGFTDGTFRPGAPVSRQSMAAFLERFAMCCLG